MVWPLARFGLDEAPAPARVKECFVVPAVREGRGRRSRILTQAGIVRGVSGDGPAGDPEPDAARHPRYVEPGGAGDGEEEDMRMTRRDAGPGVVDCAGVQALRMPCSRQGWGRVVRPMLVVLACAFAGAGQSQTLYKEGLDYAVSELTLVLVDGADLRGKRVLVESADFFELGTELRLGLSEKLRGLSSSHLTDYGVRVAMSGSDEDAVMVLHGRWGRESKTELYLELFVAEPVKSGDPTALRSAKGRVPIDEGIKELIESKPDDWGRLLVMRLDRNVRDPRRRIKVHLQPLAIKAGETTRPEMLMELLTSLLGVSLGTSSRFDVFEPVSGASEHVDGKLFGNVFIYDEDVHVQLRVRNDAGRRMAVAKVEMPKGLFRSGIFGFGSEFRDCPGCPKMVPVPVSYMMGSPESEAGRSDDEGPVHRVKFARPFAVSKHEVTRGEFARFVSERGRSMGDSCRTYEGGGWDWRSGKSWENPGFSQTDEHPVVCVSWKDAKAYVGWLSEETGKEYRLLSESEWEYVARAGTGTSRYWGEGEAGQCEYANGADEALKGEYADWPWAVASCNDGHVWTSPVGRFGANGFGLHDVLGNVWEWVEDCWNGSYRGAPADGSAWESGDCERRVLRGGSWNFIPGDLRSANRNGDPTGYRDLNAGFRVARTLTP